MSRSEEWGEAGGEEEGAADAADVARMGYVCVCTHFTCFTSAKLQILTLQALAGWGPSSSYPSQTGAQFFFLPALLVQKYKY